LTVAQRREKLALLNRMFSRFYPAEPSRALELATEALEIAGGLGESHHIAASLKSIGLCNLELRRYNEAITHFGRSRRTFEELGEQQELAGLMLAIGSAQVRLHHYPVAAVAYRESLRLSGELNDQHGTALALSALGNLHADVGDYSAALTHHLRALEIHREGSDCDIVGIGYSDIGHVHALLGDFDRALAAFEHGLSMFMETGNHYLQARALGNIGAIYLSRGEATSALESGLRVLVIQEKIGNAGGLAEALIAVAGMYRAGGGLNQAFDYFSRALRIAESLGENRLRAIALIQIGELSGERGEQWRGISLLDQALEIVGPIGDHHLESRIHYALSKIFEDIGDPDKAFEHYREHIRIREDLQGETQRKIAAELEVRFALEKAERDRENFRLRAAELERDVEQKSRELTAMAMSLVQLRSSGAETGDVESDWKIFERQLDQLHPDFLRTLSERYPDLTPAELKVCALLRTNLSTKDISGVLYLSERTVENHRYRIRRKMRLPADTNLSLLLAGMSR
ncbi:MAG: LuxR family transcriptional regulator, partial [Candidatus Kapaibacterium sp.]